MPRRATVNGSTMPRRVVVKATKVVLKSPRLRRAILRRAAHSAKKAWATPTGTVPTNKGGTKPSPRRALQPRRPFTVMTALGTAAHHTFEVRAGVGLVFEPFIGRRSAVAMWAGALPAWALSF